MIIRPNSTMNNKLDIIEEKKTILGLLIQQVVIREVQLLV